MIKPTRICYYVHCFDQKHQS